MAQALAVCKTVGLAYVGSNPTPATIKTPGQARYRAILPVGLGSGLRYRCGYLEDREGSRVWPGRSVSASTLAENRMATVLLGVVELWLSQGLPPVRPGPGCAGFGRTDLRSPARRSPRTYTGA